jgi:hypothetical protein
MMRDIIANGERDTQTHDSTASAWPDTGRCVVRTFETPHCRDRDVTIDLLTFLPATILLVLVFVPVFIAVGLMLLLKRTEARDDRRSPISEKLLHQPGSQARKQAEELGDEIMARTAVLFLVGPLCMMTILLPRVRWENLHFGWADYLAILVAVVGTSWLLLDIVKFRGQRRNWLNGMRGEMASAQVLDRLRAQGCEVFHDVPGDRGNIDHVVVGPNAVYAVETKWRSKRGQGAAAVEVWFDGQALKYPGGYRDTAAVEQANACAAELAQYLSGRTGEQVRVVPVVSLPGWYLKNHREALSSGTLAINPKMAATLVSRPGSPIPPAQRNRIIHAISDRYPQLEA